MKAGRDGVRLVERDDAEVDGFGLVVDLHQEGRPAFAAEFAMAEARGRHRLHLVRALRPDEIAVGERWRRPSPARRCSAGRCGNGTSRSRTARFSARSGPRRTCIRRSVPFVASVQLTSARALLTSPAQFPTASARGFRPFLNARVFKGISMFAAVAKSIFGSANDRYVRGLGKYVDAVNGFEAEHLRADATTSCAARPSCSASGSPTARSSTTCSPKPSRRSARRRSARSASAITTSS